MATNATYIPIPDVLIAAYTPFTARKVNRFRNNVNAIGYRPLVNTAGALNGGTSELTFTTIVSLYLFVPSHLVGPSGTHLEFLVQLDANGGAGTPEADFRIKIGANYGSTATDGGSPQALSIEWTPTPDAIVQVEFQGLINDALNSADFSWPKNGSGSIHLLVG